VLHTNCYGDLIAVSSLARVASSQLFEPNSSCITLINYLPPLNFLLRYWTEKPLGTDAVLNHRAFPRLIIHRSTHARYLFWLANSQVYCCLGEQTQPHLDHVSTPAYCKIRCQHLKVPGQCHKTYETATIVREHRREYQSIMPPKKPQGGGSTKAQVDKVSNSIPYGADQ